MIELFTEMMLRAGLGVHLRVGEIDNSRRLGFLVGKLIMLEGLESFHYIFCYIFLFVNCVYILPIYKLKWIN